jgi:RND family efflux transporter MFP subunit
MDVRADTSINSLPKGARRRRLLRRIAPFLIGAVAIFGLVATFVAPKKPAPAAEPAEGGASQLVTVIPAASREFVRTALVSGEVRPVHDVQVYAPATGVRISEVLVDAGDTVEKGQPLARLDAGVANAQILAAQAQYQEAKIEQARTADEYARIKPIADSGALSKEEIETRKAAAAAAQARLAAQQAALAQVNARMQGGFVRAPAAGFVIERNALVGEFADQKPLFRIVGDNKLEVAAAVSEKDILALKAGQTAQFKTSDGAVVEGVLRRPAVAIDPNSGTGEALFDLPADTNVRSGMYLRGEAAVESQSYLAAPQTAISYASGVPSVFVVVDGKAKLTPVTLGPRTGDYVALLSGVKAGEQIAASGGAFLLDGDLVRTAPPAQLQAEASAPRADK